ncbi:Altered inheritance rate of mitochondria protein 25 [Sesamum angolense]|uniref:Phospholipid scramblase n=1 Tax=Sesamum angolense TaxID=2727404 RepID=A0AAE1WK23_9LAMI|nr:Altered inheritance rate of mitochondria protein 25 [Sesamum angolense]
MGKDQNGVLYFGKRTISLPQPEGHPSERNTSWRDKLPCFLRETDLGCKSTSRRYMHSMQNDPDLSRDFFIRLWNADRKKPKSLAKGRRASTLNEKAYDKMRSALKQPPPSQSVTGILEPISAEEALVAPLLARSNLLITRDIEWANLVLGFEQENRYAIVDVCYPQAPVGFIREQSNFIARQLLRLRRPFIAYISDGLGNELFRVRRPFWWITSSIYAEINGEEIGVVHRRWHLWRRIYDLYLGNKQFAVVENPGLWNWTFTLKDADGNVLAEIDRNWRIFTDAGQYVIRFGSADSGVGPAAGVQELNVSRSLTLSERAVAVALAVSLDNDYFSRHGGWTIYLFLPGDFPLWWSMIETRPTRLLPAEDTYGVTNIT